MYHLSGHTQSPPGGWTFKIAELSVRAPKLAWVGPFHTFPDLVNEVVKRCKANGIAAPSIAEIEDQICQRTPAGTCRDELGQPSQQPGSMAVSAATFIQGTKTLFAWFRHGSVDEPEITRRSYICNQCPENRPIAGCSACALRDAHTIINAIVAHKWLPSDAVLHACSICNCSLRAKTRMRLEDILPHMTEEQKKRLPEKCWLVTGEPANAAADILT